MILIVVYTKDLFCCSLVYDPQHQVKVTHTWLHHQALKIVLKLRPSYGWTDFHYQLHYQIHHELWQNPQTASPMDWLHCDPNHNGLKPTYLYT